MDNQRVPPIPKSLSNNANLSESSDDQGNHREVAATETTTTSTTKLMFTPRIDGKLSILKQEMVRKLSFNSNNNLSITGEFEASRL